MSNRRKLIPSKTLYVIVGHGRTWVDERKNPKSPKFDPRFPQPIKVDSITNRYVESEAYDYVDYLIEKDRAEHAA